MNFAKIFFLTLIAAMLSAGTVIAESGKLEQTVNKPKKGGHARLGTIADGRKAAAALDEILRAYGTGNVNFIRERLDPSMIGFQKLLDGVVTETNQCKQMRVRLVDTQIQAGPDLVVIQSNWEKRCLQLPNLVPRLYSGHSTFLMHLGTAGWSIAAVSGTNPLAQSVPVGSGRF